MSESDTEWFQDSIDDHNKLSYAKYQTALARGVAKEQARLYLPPTLMVEFWVSMNARALMNFVRLRNEDSAMWEIRQYAIEVENFFASLMPMTHEAFNDAGRMAP